MSFPHRPLPSHLRSSSAANASSSASGQSPLLLARINEKKAELASLKELQDLSGALADQMETLEDKLSTLTDGTEAVAAVLSNWGNVLRAISLASTKIPKPKGAEDEVVAEETKVDAGPPLPQTLVRIPVDQAAALESQQGSGD
ncbi:hypothetical protein P152DRAFT_400074 [Eremomyces bilateralis CBS 781.70]|uniref:DASH complex subunit DAD2 n=1 Tax=Eremomyces bilateralis CBS 781.70 TaxID=1392243 RepID=A0A6G1FZB3_9PEZI|nr:uncharacterized protein P152DRAFT_400074 [Eremomyces bilateralis CBS 781.70]KAF1811133.1 hypothetical protein P152DRAFT_400074 [Eremomyces bilateralis CBS 781.70]